MGRRERLYIHVVEPVRKDGRTVLARVPENKEIENMGIKYRMTIVKTDDKHAECYCWDTGYAGCGGSEEMPTPEAHIYAPNGFQKGNLAFVTAVDGLIGTSRRSSTSVDSFLENLSKMEFDRVAADLQGFTFVGEIE